MQQIKQMDFAAGQGAMTRHSGSYGEELQQRPATKDAVLCFIISDADHSLPE